MAVATVTGRLSTSSPGASGIHCSSFALSQRGVAGSTASYAHGLGVVPDFVLLQQGASVSASLAPAVSAQWDATNVSLTNWGPGEIPQMNTVAVSAWSAIR